MDHRYERERERERELGDNFIVSATTRSEEVHASRIRVFKRSSVVPQQQHDHHHHGLGRGAAAVPKPECLFVFLFMSTSTCFIDDQADESRVVTVTVKESFLFNDLTHLSSHLSLELLVNFILQKKAIGLVGKENWGILAAEVSDILSTRFTFSEEAIYGSTTSLVISVQVNIRVHIDLVYEALDRSNNYFEIARTPSTDHQYGSSTELLWEQEITSPGHVAPDDVTSSATPDAQTSNLVHQEEEEEGDNYDFYMIGSEEEEDDDDEDEEMESLDSSLDANSDDRVSDSDDDLINGDGPKGYEEVVAFEVIVGDGCKNTVESHDQCSICLENYMINMSCTCGGDHEIAKMNSCGLMFPKDCISKWLATYVTCPICRSPCIALV